MPNLLIHQSRTLRDQIALLHAETLLVIAESKSAVQQLHQVIGNNQWDVAIARSHLERVWSPVEGSWQDTLGAYVPPIAHPASGELADRRALQEERDWLLLRRVEILESLAYEVRQPLNNASAALESAQQVMAHADDAAERRKASERLQRAQGLLIQVASALDNTLADAVLLGGTDPARREDMDIDTLLGLVVAEIDHRQRHRVQIQRDTATRTASMNGVLMRLALRNLVTNALAYSPAGSPVKISVADCDDPLALQLEVCDQGPGLPTELVPRLFERGAHGLQTRNQLGHGLGLYIVRRVMELHGGSVQASPIDPTGVCMRLLLPQ